MARSWWQETRNELRKVTWPTREQTRNLTLVVVAVCIVMATFLGVVDYVLSQVVRFIIGL
jgi:preprotein translocase subunit SecE